MKSERYLGLDHTRSCRSLADWMWCVRERRVKDDVRVLDLSDWKNKLAFYQDKEE